jgi:hypothetical protein
VIHRQVYSPGKKLEVKFHYQNQVSPGKVVRVALLQQPQPQHQIVRSASEPKTGPVNVVIQSQPRQPEPTPAPVEINVRLSTEKN